MNTVELEYAGGTYKVCEMATMTGQKFEDKQCWWYFTTWLGYSDKAEYVFAEDATKSPDEKKIIDNW